jgi:PAS domain S-box-containing protein
MAMPQEQDAVRHVLDRMLEGVQIIGPDWKYIYVNEAVARQGRSTVKGLLGKTMMEMYPGIERSPLFAVLERVMKEKKAELYTNEFEYPDKNKGWFELSIQPVPAGIVILSIDITERKRAELRILEMNQDLEKKVKDRTARLEAVNRELETFSYSVSHDLRAPLRAINGYADILREDLGPQLGAEGQRLLDIIKSNALRMSVLIDDLLVLSRLGRKELQCTLVNMDELAEGVLIELNKTITHKAAVKVGPLGFARVDYGLIHQALYNLVNNAVKYSSKKENALVEISAQQQDGSMVYTVKDNGAGFDMKYSSKLFGVFQRLHSDDEFEGTGVGLAIVQRIVTRHGGKVWAHAEPGNGAMFSFSIPSG